MDKYPDGYGYNYMISVIPEGKMFPIEEISVWINSKGDTNLSFHSWHKQTHTGMTDENLLDDSVVLSCEKKAKGTVRSKCSLHLSRAGLRDSLNGYYLSQYLREFVGEELAYMPVTYSKDLTIGYK